MPGGGRERVFVLVTHFELDGPRIDSRGLDFPCRPDLPRGPSKSLHIGPGSFPCVKMPERGADYRVANVWGGAIPLSHRCA